jgi:hypothetical protein
MPSRLLLTRRMEWKRRGGGRDLPAGRGQLRRALHALRLPLRARMPAQRPAARYLHLQPLRVLLRAPLGAPPLPPLPPLRALSCRPWPSPQLATPHPITPACVCVCVCVRAGVAGMVVTSAMALALWPWPCHPPVDPVQVEQLHLKWRASTVGIRTSLWLAGGSSQVGPHDETN